MAVSQSRTENVSDEPETPHYTRKQENQRLLGLYNKDGSQFEETSSQSETI